MKANKKAQLVIEDSSKKDFLDGPQSPENDMSMSNYFNNGNDEDEAIGFEEEEEEAQSQEKKNSLSQINAQPDISFEQSSQLDMSRIHMSKSISSLLSLDPLNIKNSHQQHQNFSKKDKPPTDDEGLTGSSPNVKQQKQSKIKSFIKNLTLSSPERKSRYETNKPSVIQDESSERTYLAGDQQYDETTNMLTQPNPLIELPGFRFQFSMMIFIPMYFILFFVPYPIFAIMHFIRFISNEAYATIQATYAILMFLLFMGVNIYAYYRIKKEKKDSQSLKQESSQLNKIFNRDDSQLLTSKNMMKILALNLVSIIGLIDTAFDIQFVAICYGSGVVWLAIIIGLCYIYTFFDKIHSTRKLFGLAKDQYKKRFDKSILKMDHQKQIQFYSSCLTIFSLPMAEIFTRANLKTINLQQRVLIFEIVHILVQKLIFVALKIVYSFIDSRNKSSITTYAIPMNVICAITSFLYIIYKYRDLDKSKKNEDLSNSGSQVKRFQSQVASSSIKFRQSDASDLVKLEQVVQEIEDGRKRKGTSLNDQKIDKLKVKLISGDIQALKGLVGIVKKQHFLREISFYKMRFTSDHEFECLSKIAYLRKLGLTKISFKECTMQESMIGQLIAKQDLSEHNTKLSIIKDISLQLKVHDQTDYEIIYQQLRKLIEINPIQILFEPLFYSKRRDDSFMSKFGEHSLSILGESQYWPQAITSEYQHIKRLYLVQPTKKFKGQILLFKDRNMQELLDQVIYQRIEKKYDGELDLANLRDIFTHSYHQERFIELILRALEDNIDQVTNLHVRLLNDQGFQEKYNFLGLKLNQLKRLLHLIPSNHLIKFHLNMTPFSFQDTKSIEALFLELTDFFELQQRSLKHLIFTDISFDLNSNAEKDFYNTLSFPNFTSIILNNCKFLCYDAFERFFLALADTENSLEHLEINRLNSAVSAKGFRELLLSQTESLKHLILTGVHKNILSKKHHKKILPAISQINNLRTLSLKKNQLDYEKLKHLSEKMKRNEGFQELTELDLSSNALENNAILVIAKILRQRQFSLETLNLSENCINEEGLNLLLKGKTDEGGYLLTKGIVANNMLERNYLINNAKASKLDRLDISGSFAPGADPSVAVQGFQMLGILNNNLRILDASNNSLSTGHVQVMIEKFFSSKLCNIISLNVSNQRFDEGNIDALQKYLVDSPVLENLILNDCRLRDSFGAKILISWFSQKNKTNKYRGQLHLEGNLLGESLFLNVLDEMDEIDGQSQQQQPQGTKGPWICQQLNLGRNLLIDEAVGNDFLRVLQRVNCKIVSLDLHGNSSLGRPTLIQLRSFLEDQNKLAFNDIDLSDCPKCLKSAVILEMRSRGELNKTKVIYTRDSPKEKNKKK